MSKIYKTAGALLLAGAAVLWTSPAMAQATPQKKAKPVEHAVTGTVKAVDAAAKTVSIDTAEGTEKVFNVSEDAVVTSGKGTGKYTELATKKGSHVVVRYTEDAGKMTATGFDEIGKANVKVAKGTVVKTDDAAKTVTIKTEQGAEETFHLAEGASVDTARGVAKGTEKGAQVTVHYTDEAGKKVAHFIKHPY